MAERRPDARPLYALRKDLSTEDVIIGSKELRLDPARVSSDVAELASAVSRPGRQCQAHHTLYRPDALIR
jgi:hypothetical protein